MLMGDFGHTMARNRAGSAESKDIWRQDRNVRGCRGGNRDEGVIMDMSASAGWRTQIVTWVHCN